MSQIDTNTKPKVDKAEVDKIIKDKEAIIKANQIVKK